MGKKALMEKKGKKMKTNKQKNLRITALEIGKRVCG